MEVVKKYICKWCKEDDENLFRQQDRKLCKKCKKCISRIKQNNKNNRAPKNKDIERMTSLGYDIKLIEKKNVTELDEDEITNEDLLK